MENQVLAVLVSNHFGVLTRVTNLFSRRGFNIKELTVGETDDPEYSRITILTEGDARLVGQIKEQLAKLEDVKVVSALPEGGMLRRELLLVKIAYPEEACDSFKKTVAELGGRVFGPWGCTAIAEYTGDTADVDAFIMKIQKYKVMELCRTGIAALQTGSTTLYEIKMEE